MTQIPDEARLPPPFELVRLRETGEAFAHACAEAARLGAGAIVRTGRFDRIELAVVLEPDEALTAARRAFFLCMGAAARALAAHVPPQLPVAILWPDTITLGARPLGGGRLGWPAGCAERARPDWLVFGLDLVAATGEIDEALLETMSRAMSGGASDLAPMAISLDEAGVTHVDPQHFAADFARALLAATDALAHDGFEAAARPYLEALELEKAGARARIEANGDLVETLHGAQAGERRPFVPALAEARWRRLIGDAARGEET